MSESTSFKSNKFGKFSFSSGIAASFAWNFPAQSVLTIFLSKPENQEHILSTLFFQKKEVASLQPVLGLRVGAIVGDV